MSKVWVAVPGYEGRYEATRSGKVRNACTKHVLRPGPCTKYGHLTVSLGRRNSQLVSRIVMLTFVGPCPAGKEVLHCNGIARDNRLTNLRYGSRSENNIDGSRHGTRGKLTIAQVQWIRHTDEKTVVLAQQFGVSHTTISAARHRQNWKHVR